MLKIEGFLEYLKYFYDIESKANLAVSKKWDHLDSVLLIYNLHFLTTHLLNP